MDIKHSPDPLMVEEQGAMSVKDVKIVDSHVSETKQTLHMSRMHEALKTVQISY